MHHQRVNDDPHSRQELVELEVLPESDLDVDERWRKTAHSHASPQDITNERRKVST